MPGEEISILMRDSLPKIMPHIPYGITGKEGNPGDFLSQDPHLFFLAWKMDLRRWSLSFEMRPRLPISTQKS